MVTGPEALPIVSAGTEAAAAGAVETGALTTTGAVNTMATAGAAHGVEAAVTGVAGVAGAALETLAVPGLAVLGLCWGFNKLYRGIMGGPTERII